MELTAKRKNGIFATILVSCIACSMLSTALNTALPQILVDFKIDSSTGQWLTSIYSLVMGILTLATPFLIRRFSARGLYLGTLLIFLLGLLLSGCTGSFGVMMAGRVLQAAGNGIMVAQGQVLILTMFPLEKRGSVMGLYGLAIGTSPVIAPALAGIVVDAFGWRMIFYMVAAVTAVSAVMTGILFADVLDHEKSRLDISSLVLCSVGVCGLLLGAGNIGKYFLTDVRVWLPLVCGLAGTMLFVARQLRMESPFMELRILKVPRYRTAVIASMVMYATVMASSILLPIYIQSVLGCSAALSGLVTMPGALATALISPISGRLYDKFGMKRLFLAGSVMLTAGNLGTALILESGTLLGIGVLNVVRCAGIGCLMMPFVTWGMSGLEKQHTSHGTALITSMRTVAGAFGSAIFVAVYNMGAKSEMPYRGMKAAFTGLAILGALEILLACRQGGKREP